MPIQFVESTVSYTRIKEHLRRFTMKVNVWNLLNTRVPMLREYFVAGDLEFSRILRLKSSKYYVPTTLGPFIKNNREHMDVSENRGGPPKWMVCKGKPY